MTMGIFSKEFWLKIIAFVLAVIIWAYAREDLDSTPGYIPENPHHIAPAEIPQR
ncbi:MAG TPA: hypothetical protein PLA52_06640 [Candidatus Omnitrophota bacterium]|jgi:YbbR domain-containing protein|nr:hypothetical protein [Candidatus Omnitrophota bacterium]HOX10303.1 hypothetical protein [Candidatus Omnitrophota bacterium]